MLPHVNSFDRSKFTTYIYDIHYSVVCGDYAAAVKCYIMAGAIDSMFFVKDVSTNVWSQQVFLVSNIQLHSKSGHMHLKYNAFVSKLSTIVRMYLDSRDSFFIPPQLTSQYKKLIKMHW